MSDTKSMKKKEGLQKYLEYSLNSILNIFYRSGYRAMDPEFGQNRIRNTDFLLICIQLYTPGYLDIIDVNP